MSNIYPVGLVLVVVTSVLPLNARSEKIPARGAIPFVAYDKDNSGTITEKEFRTAHEKRKTSENAKNVPTFSAFDKNADGLLTQDELVAGQMAQIAKRRRKEK